MKTYNNGKTDAMNKHFWFLIGIIIGMMLGMAIRFIF